MNLTNVQSRKLFLVKMIELLPEFMLNSVVLFSWCVEIPNVCDCVYKTNWNKTQFRSSSGFFYGTVTYCLISVSHNTWTLYQGPSCIVDGPGLRLNIFLIVSSSVQCRIFSPLHLAITQIQAGIIFCIIRFIFYFIFFILRWLNASHTRSAS